MPINHNRYAMIFFMDGVGLGENDAATNPYVSAQLPHLTRLGGAGNLFNDAGPYITERSSFVPTDAACGVAGLPQSATGQAMILSGRNVSKAIGEHYGPKPNDAVRAELAKGTIFDQVRQAGGRAALLSPYPNEYFAAIDSGKRRYSSVPQAVVNAGVPLFGPTEMRSGAAVSPEFTGEGWHSFLGYEDVPLRSLQEAGETLAELARAYTFSFFEHWPSDRLGHRGTLEEAVAHLEILDEVIGSLVDAWPAQDGLLIITSDHGNIEDKSRRSHTLNPVPTILVGQDHTTYAPLIHNLTDIAQVVAKHLAL